jgi:hypothetical protein
MTISADDLDAARMTSASLARILSLATERLAGFAPGLARTTPGPPARSSPRCGTTPASRLRER